MSSPVRVKDWRRLRMTTGTLWADLTTDDVHSRREKLWLRPLMMNLNVTSHKLSFINPCMVMMLAGQVWFALFKKKNWAIFTLLFKYLGRILFTRLFTFHGHKTLPGRRAGQIHNLNQKEIRRSLARGGRFAELNRKGPSAIVCVRGNGFLGSMSIVCEVLHEQHLGAAQAGLL